jgi:hypothetical protein
MIVINIKPIKDSATGCSFENIKDNGNIIAKLSTIKRINDLQNNETQKEKASDQDTVLFMFFSIYRLAREVDRRLALANRKIMHNHL